MEKILRGALKYKATDKALFLADMSNITSEINKPVTVLLSCIDARVLPLRFTKSTAGEVFYVRNAGNMVPHYHHYADGNISTEGAALELACVVNKIRNVVVCGHSDCKAVNALYQMRNSCDHRDHHLESPLKTWVAFHGAKTIQKVSQVLREENNSLEVESVNDIPSILTFNIGAETVKATIDPENQFHVQDKFSQIHCLQQASHVSSYPFLQALIHSGELKIHAMWFDVFSGDVFIFNPRQGCFVVINEENVEQLVSDMLS